ncbi:hypothetical protein ABW19_dt0206676 [Dactylella cylindrospora]|nr:hypothetical protein ABW19_dt0206676 [Dactylella cylindrospora]
MSSNDTAIDASSHLYNTSFNLHKLTPLNLNGSFASPSNLKSHSTRLANIIRGDVLRGVRVVSEASQTEDPASKTGNLQRVDLTPIQIVGSGDGEALNAVAVVFRYEKITYSAFLVQSATIASVAAATAPSRRTSLRRASMRAAELSNYYPLLLTRLPAWLQARFTGYLSENFDCHISNLRLPDGFIMKAIENYLGFFAPSDSVLDNNQPNKNLQVWFEPPMVTKSAADGEKEAKLQTLRTISMTFTREDIPGMVYKGTQLKEKQDEEGIPENRGPFELALSLYAYHHMGIFLEKLKIQKASCGEFVAGVAADGSGKCKFFPPRRNNQEADESTASTQRKSWDGMLTSLVELAS